MAKNKPKRAAHQPAPPSSAQQQTRGWLAGPGPWLTAAIAFIAWLLLNAPEALQNLRVMPEEARKAIAQYQSWLHEDSEWTGNWTISPEGVVDTGDLTLSNDEVQITIWATGGEIDGTVVTTRICESVPFDYVLLRGKVYGNHARVTAWDIAGSRKFDFAQLRLDRDGQVMTVTPLEGNVHWFPKAARIARAPLEDGTEPKPDTTFCNGKQRARGRTPGAS